MNDSANDLFKGVGFDGSIFCGVDEVGRGPLAGPVVAAAVVLDEDQRIPGITDSKKLSAAQRFRLDQSIRERAKAWAIGRCESVEIDNLGILPASLLAMQRAVNLIDTDFDVALIDGNIAPELDCETVTVVRGDALVDSIGAASIVAKVARDAEMVKIAALYPEYGFEKHKGYPTPFHLGALKLHGPCPIHRRTFRPVAELKSSLNYASTV